MPDDEPLDEQKITVVKNERGVGTGETRSGVEPRPNADGSLPPTGNARNPAIVEDPRDPAQRTEPGKTPGKAEG